MTHDVFVDQVTNLLAVVLLVEIFVSAGCAVYTLLMYRASNRNSQTFRTIARDDLLKVIAGAWIGVLAVFRLIPHPDAVTLPPITTPVSAIVVIILLYPPIDHAITFIRLRREHRGAVDADTPPWTED